jgi:hypothetical protein
MNIFFLDKNPELCAQYHCDKHIPQQINTIANILSTVMRKSGIIYGIYGGNKNHPYVLWAEEEDGNFLWLRRLGMGLCEEYSFRYSYSGADSHAMEHIIRDCYPESSKKAFGWENQKKETKMTKAPQCIPSYFKCYNIIKAYRDYYLVEKAGMLIYTKRNVPEWIEKLGLGEHR